eukprot:403365113
MAQFQLSNIFLKNKSKKTSLIVAVFFILAISNIQQSKAISIKQQFHLMNEQADTFSQQVQKLTQTAFSKLESKIQNYGFDHSQYLIGMGGGLASILITQLYPQYGSMFMSIPHSFFLDLKSPAMAVFNMVSKLSTETYHFFKPEATTALQKAQEDVNQGILTGVVLLFLNGQSYQLGLNMIQFVFTTTRYCILNAQAKKGKLDTTFIGNSLQGW